jgi:cobalt-zinc-cadmium efflux system membrane fusion protein
MSTVWVLANVHENQPPFVQWGDPVSIKTDAYPELFHGRISFMGAALMPPRGLCKPELTQKPCFTPEERHVCDCTVVAGKIDNALMVLTGRLAGRGE